MIFQGNEDTCVSVSYTDTFRDIGRIHFSCQQSSLFDCKLGGGGDCKLGGGHCKLGGTVSWGGGHCKLGGTVSWGGGGL